MESPTATELNALKVSELKALCRDRNIAGFSKAKKSDLIQKLLDCPSSSARAPIKTRRESLRLATPVFSLPKPNTNISQTLTKTAAPSSSHLVLLSSPDSLAVVSPANAPCQPLVSRRSPPLSSAVSRSHQSFRNSTPTPDAITRTIPTKRVAQTHHSVVTKKLKTDTASVPAARTIVPNRSSQALAVLPSAAPNASELPHKVKVLSTSKPLSNTGRRFFPPTVKKPKIPSAPPLKLSYSEQARSVYHLDFPDVITVTLENISRPPALSQRRNVDRYALMLSRVAESDLAQCICVSKTFRYAVYLSAFYRLRRDFPGARLDAIRQSYNERMTNMWPYLRQRQRELDERTTKFRSSFLSTVFEGRNVIASRLWTNPDHEKQVTVALRFLLTRLFFVVSVGQDTPWAVQIINVQEVVPGEVWSVKLKNGSVVETFHVLEATCEPIGRPNPAEDANNSNLADQKIDLRADWSSYVLERLVTSVSVNEATPKALLDHIAWPNHEEYDRGIGRHWLKQIRHEGQLGAVKELIAQRYVFACVVANSLSGQWKSQAQMEQDFSGDSSAPNWAPVARKKNSVVNMFLPTHHLVESVHVTASKGRPLHPALAIVQTPGREYFILKDNGLQVGSEEEGVAPIWKHMLGCSRDGVGNV